jgi:hypothetical protein
MSGVQPLPGKRDEYCKIYELTNIMLMLIIDASLFPMLVNNLEHSKLLHVCLVCLTVYLLSPT